MNTNMEDTRSTIGTKGRFTSFVADNGLILLVMALVLGNALASSGATGGGTEFQDLYNLVLGWTEGLLGKTIAVSAFLIGMIMGVAKQSLWAFAIGILFAAAFAFGPGIIDGVFTAGFDLSAIH